MGWNDFSVPACGEWFDNEDGTSRQTELAECRTGEQVELVREPDNPHDPAAVAIFSRRGIRIGYLRRDRAVWIGSKIDRCYDVRAIVERVKGSHLPGATLGLVIRVNMEGEEPDLDVSSRHRRHGSAAGPRSGQTGAEFQSMVSGMVSQDWAEWLCQT